jgi:S1-C subfamily serine protease
MFFGNGVCFFIDSQVANVMKGFKYFLVYVSLLGVFLCCGGCDRGGGLILRTESPVFVSGAAGELSGIGIEGMAVVAEDTVSDVPLTTQTIRKVAEESKKAVVTVYSSKKKASVFGLSGKETTSLGSGFFIHPSGYILTNYHVIEDAEAIMIRTYSEEDFEVNVIAYDTAFDLAMLKVKDAKGDFPVIAMGDSEKLGVGDMTIAIGHPFGLGYSVTFGIISQKERLVAEFADEDLRDMRVIQMDTSIHPGSSGGPLITLTGAWVGVNVAGIPSVAGISFAVGSDKARKFMENISGHEGKQ